MHCTASELTRCALLYWQALGFFSCRVIAGCRETGDGSAEKSHDYLHCYYYIEETETEHKSRQVSSDESEAQCCRPIVDAE